VQVLRGGLLFLVTCLFAYPTALVYHEPRLVYMLPAAAVVTVLGGFNSTALFAVRRHLLVGRLTLLEVGAQLTGVVVMCTLARMHPSVWAMIAGLATTSTVMLVGGYFLLPGYRNRFAWDRDALRDLFHFGKWVFVSTTILFCAMQLDRLMLGRMISLSELGVYSVAAAIAMLPNLLLQALSGTVLYPLLSRLARNSTQTLRDRLPDAREILLAPAIFCVTGVVLEAPTFFALLYNESYADAGRIARLLSLGVWLSIIGFTLERALLAIGDTRSPAAANFVKLVASAIGASVGFSLAGLAGFIVGYACGATCGHAALLYQAAARGLSAWREDVRMSALLALTVALGLSLAQSVEDAYGPIAREIAVWSYLAALGVWAAMKLRQLKHIQI
jgi:O-antigen/teichoic acid export membrane protein